MKIRDEHVSLSFCIKKFKNIMNLFCVHIIEKRIIDADCKEVLLFFDIHAHWRFEKSKRYFVDFAVFVDIETEKNETSNHDSLLNIQNSQKIQSKKRFKFAFNRSKTTAEQQRLKTRQRAFDISIQQKSSEFEFAEIIDLTANEMIQVSCSQSFFDDYIIMSSFFSQLYSRFITQYIDEFTNSTTLSTIISTAISTTISKIGHKRRININITNNNKRIKKTI